MKISIVTGTLNRCHLLPQLINNTVDSDGRLELVLVDGGSTDGTIEYLKILQHPQIQLIEYGQRSSYPHYMNLGIKNATHDLICQWNDDVLLLNLWQEVFDEIDEHDVFLFNWSEQNRNQSNLYNHGKNGGEVVMNYGIYKRYVFERAGLYNMSYQYYCADGEMSLRAYCLGYKFKNLHNIKVVTLPVEKIAIAVESDFQLYNRIVKEYHAGQIDKNVEYLECKS